MTLQSHFECAKCICVRGISSVAEDIVSHSWICWQRERGSGGMLESLSKSAQDAYALAAFAVSPERLMRKRKLRGVVKEGWEVGSKLFSTTVSIWNGSWHDGKCIVWLSSQTVSPFYVSSFRKKLQIGTLLFLPFKIQKCSVILHFSLTLALINLILAMLSWCDFLFILPLSHPFFDLFSSPFDPHGRKKRCDISLLPKF